MGCMLAGGVAIFTKGPVREMKSRKRLVKPVNPTLCVGYIRVSTDEQALGPEAQRASIVSWAGREGVTIASWHFDLGVSGAAPIDQRTGLLGAFAAIDQTHAGVLAVAKRDRLTRGDVVAGAIIERMVQDLGARVVSAAGEGTNGDDPASILMRRIVDAFAEHERLIIAMRTKAALAAKKARGERVGGVPYGWTSVDGKLVHVLSEQSAVRAAKALRARGASLNEIAEALDAKGRVNRSGGRFHPMQISRMVAEE